MTESIRYTISLPTQLNIKLKNMASKLGLPIATFIRHLVIEEVKKTAIPCYPMSQELKNIITKANNDYNEGKLKEFHSVDEMFASLSK